MNPHSSVFFGLFASTYLLAKDGDMSPTLEVLPLNSTLSDVTIPRYDENKKRVAYLKANLMEILADGKPVGDRQPIMVDCTGIQLRMEAEAAGGDIDVDMERARYRVAPGVLTVQETITASSPKFSLTGNGGVFHLDTRRGFVFGPLDCKIYQFQTAQLSDMPTSLPILLASTSLITFNASYKPATPAQLLEIEQAAKPTQIQIHSQQATVAKASHQHDNNSSQANNKLIEFAEAVDSKSLNLLIQNPPPANPPTQVKPPLENPDLTIHCDGGCFFDGNENLLVLLRNIVVNEARFTLKAQEEVKVFFNEEPAPEEKEGQTEEKKKDPSLNLDLTDVKSLVATGGVHFSGIDKKGNPVEASAATAYYDHKKQELILKGGLLTFWTKAQNREFHFQAEDANAYVRIELSDETMSAHTSPTGWTFGGKGLRLKK